MEPKLKIKCDIPIRNLGFVKRKLVLSKLYDRYDSFIIDPDMIKGMQCYLIWGLKENNDQSKLNLLFIWQGNNKFLTINEQLEVINENK